MLLVLLLSCDNKEPPPITDPVETTPAVEADVLVTSEVSFGVLEVGESISQAVLIQNAGEGALEIGSVSLSGGAVDA